MWRGGFLPRVLCLLTCRVPQDYAGARCQGAVFAIWRGAGRELHQGQGDGGEQRFVAPPAASHMPDNNPAHPHALGLDPVTSDADVVFEFACLLSVPVR
jgi:hypothetical protein